MPFPTRAAPAVESSPLALPPLQQALHHELFARPAALAQRSAYADFWRAQSSAQGKDGQSTRRFGRDIVDADFLDEAIAQRKAALEKKRAEKAARDAVVNSAADLSVLSISLSSSAPTTYLDPLDGEEETALSAHSDLRELARARDSRALQYLRLEREVSRLKAERMKVGASISAKRTETSSLLAALQQRPESGRTRVRALQGDEGARVRRLEKALGAARGKREMVRGVLRGLVLESGLDWLADDALKEALLGMGDEGESDEEDEGEMSDEGDD